MPKIRILHILGIDDSNRIEVLFWSPDLNRNIFNFAGNVHLLSLIQHPDFKVNQIRVGGMKGEPLKVPKADLIFNAICDPDINRKSLHAVLNIVNTLKVPVINHPERIMLTGRDHIYQLFHNLEGVLVPKTIRVQPRYLSEVVKLVDTGEIGFPFLIREAGSHGGTKREFIKSIDLIHELDKFALDGRDYYVTEFVKFLSPDGLYRKYRVIVIGGKPYPRHLIISPFWNVHAENRNELMDKYPECRKEEETFLKEFGQKNSNIFERFYEVLKLDYFGVDFSLAPDGKMIVFEINSCFRAIAGKREAGVAEQHEQPHYAPCIENIKKAVEELIIEKAGNVRYLSGNI